MKCGRAPHFQSGAGGTALPAASIRRFPALSDSGKSLCSAGMRSLRGRSQHGEAEVTLQHLEGVPAFCSGETEAAAVRGAGMQFVTSLGHADPGGTGGVWDGQDFTPHLRCPAVLGMAKAADAWQCQAGLSPGMRLPGWEWRWQEGNGGHEALTGRCKVRSIWCCHPAGESHGSGKKVQE